MGTCVSGKQLKSCVHAVEVVVSGVAFVYFERMPAIYTTLDVVPGRPTIVDTLTLAP